MTPPGMVFSRPLQWGKDGISCHCCGYRQAFWDKGPGYYFEQGQVYPNDPVCCSASCWELAIFNSKNRTMRDNYRRQAFLEKHSIEQVEFDAFQNILWANQTFLEKVELDKILQEGRGGNDLYTGNSDAIQWNDISPPP